jgi:hypothetical protein
MQPTVLGYEVESLKLKRQRIVELKNRDSIKPPHRVSLSIAAFLDSPLKKNSRRKNNESPL